MNSYISDPCSNCSCRATGEIIREHLTGVQAVKWDPPRADCTCRCHEPWRFIHRGETAAEVAA